MPRRDWAWSAHIARRWLGWRESTVETVEHQFVFDVVDAGSAITHLDPHLRPGRSARVDFDRAAAGMLCRVCDEVADRVDEELTVGVNREQRLATRLDAKIDPRARRRPRPTPRRRRWPPSPEARRASGRAREPGSVRTRRARRCDWRSITPRKRSRSAGSFFGANLKDSRTALEIAESGVRSSCAAFATNSRSARSRRTLTVTSVITRRAVSAESRAGTPATANVNPSRGETRNMAAWRPSSKSDAANACTSTPGQSVGSFEPASSPPPSQQQLCAGIGEHDRER